MAPTTAACTAHLLENSDVVLVVPNYRLGPLGFLCLEDDRAPGNLGLRDQSAALRWVRDHVGAFGGDPADVTLMGESAGGMSALLHLVSPPSGGLFRKVVALSASASTPFMHSDRSPAEYGRAFADQVLKKRKKDKGGGEGEGEDQVGKMLRRLRGVSARSIVEKTTVFKVLIVFTTFSKIEQRNCFGVLPLLLKVNRSFFFLIGYRSGIMKVVHVVFC